MAREATILQLPVEAISPSPSNPRRTMDAEQLERLATSIREHGVQQPVLVRPHPSGKRARYELVFGHRRLAASKLAGQTTIPAQVRDLDDRQVLELQVIENAAREDVPPLEEADGLRRLHAHYGLAVEELAARLGKSQGYVYSRLQLCGLPEVAKEALGDGRLLLSVALLIARIPSVTVREAAARHLVDEGRDGEPCSIGLARDAIARLFARRLDGAPFDVSDAMLSPAAGSCTACPKRTGNQRSLFPDLTSDDVCTDPPCFRQKVDAEFERRAGLARAAGRAVADEAQAREIFSAGGRWTTYEYVDLNERHAADQYFARDPERGDLPLRDRLGERAEAIAILVRDPNGEIRAVARRSDVEAIVGARRRGEESPEARAEREREDREWEERQAAAELRRKARAESLAKVRAAIRRGPESTSTWLALAWALAGEAAGDGYECVVSALEALKLAPADSADWGDDAPVRLLETLSALPGEDVRALVAQVLLDRVDGEVELKQILELFGVDLAAIERRLKREAAKPATPKEKRAAGAKTRASASALED